MPTGPLLQVGIGIHTARCTLRSGCGYTFGNGSAVFAWLGLSKVKRAYSGNFDMNINPVQERAG